MTRATHPAALAAAGALGACLAFLAVAPAITDAGPEAAAPPAARAGPVRFEAELVHDGAATAVRIRARNAGDGAQGCRVRAAVVRERGNPMSRVLTMPEPVWNEAVALRVPARGEAVRTVQLPASAPAPSRRKAAAAEETLRVFLAPERAADVEVG